MLFASHSTTFSKVNRKEMKSKAFAYYFTGSKLQRNTGSTNKAKSLKNLLRLFFQYFTNWSLVHEFFHPMYQFNYNYSWCTKMNIP